MIRILSLIFCSVGFLNCVGLAIASQMCAAPTMPNWILLWFLGTCLISILGLSCAFLHVSLGIE